MVDDLNNQGLESSGSLFTQLIQDYQVMHVPLCFLCGLGFSQHSSLTRELDSKRQGVEAARIVQHCIWESLLSSAILSSGPPKFKEAEKVTLEGQVPIAERSPGMGDVRTVILGTYCLPYRFGDASLLFFFFKILFIWVSKRMCTRVHKQERQRENQTPR